MAHLLSPERPGGVPGGAVVLLEQEQGVPQEEGEGASHLPALPPVQGHQLRVSPHPSLPQPATRQALYQ